MYISGNFEICEVDVEKVIERDVRSLTCCGQKWLFYELGDRQNLKYGKL